MKKLLAVELPVIAGFSVLALVSLLLPPLLAGFLSLLQSLFGALALPFKLLFSLAGWSTSSGSLDSVIQSMQAPLTHHPLLTATSAVLIALGAILSFQESRRPWLALLCSVSGAILAGPVAGCILLPALAFELIALRHAASSN